MASPPCARRLHPIRRGTAVKETSVILGALGLWGVVALFMGWITDGAAVFHYGVFQRGAVVVAAMLLVSGVLHLAATDAEKGRE